MKILRSAICFALALALTFMAVYFISFAVNDGEYGFIVPAVVFIIMAIVLFRLFMLEAFIGYREYRFENGVITVSRNDRILAEIPKDKLDGVTIVYDVFSKSFDGVDEVHYVSFKYCGKRYFISALRIGEEKIKALIDDIDIVKKTNNVSYYLLSFLSFIR